MIYHARKTERKTLHNQFRIQGQRSTTANVGTLKSITFLRFFCQNKEYLVLHHVRIIFRKINREQTYLYVPGCVDVDVVVLSEGVLRVWRAFV